MTDDFDDLDRAIFALPLATPPPGLREAILRSTIYATAEPVLAFATREIVAIGAALAVIVWLALSAVADRAFGSALSAQISALVYQLADLKTLAWLATGIAVAAVVTAPGSSLLRRSIDTDRT